MRCTAKALLLPAVLATIWLASSPSHAQISREDSAAAQVLFDDGVRLRKEGDFEEACPKFAESQRLDPQLGTLMNLADCYEKWGKTASAWISFVEAAGLAKKKKDRREKIARQRAEKLQGRLQKMKLEVQERPDKLKITRNGTEIRPPTWGSEVPVDPGEHLIEAKAPGYQTWSTTITVNEGDDLAVVEVPALEPAGGGETPSGDGDSSSSDSSPDGADGSDEGGTNTALLVSGIAVGVLGLGGIGAGIGLGLMSTSKDDESLEHCRPDDPNICDAEGVSLRDEALSLEKGTIGAYIGGGALLVTGVVLVTVALVGGDDEKTSADRRGDRRSVAASLPHIELLPSAGPDGAGVLIQGRF